MYTDTVSEEGSDQGLELLNITLSTHRTRFGKGWLDSPKENRLEGRSIEGNKERHVNYTCRVNVTVTSCLVLSTSTAHKALDRSLFSLDIQSILLKAVSTCVSKRVNEWMDGLQII